MTDAPPVRLYAAIGPALVRYEADVGAARLGPGEAQDFPLDIQYAWRHPAPPVAYLALSDGGPGARGKTHLLAACRIDPADGALSPLGPPAELRGRPLHLSTDRDGRHLLAAYNDPSAITVHALAGDGSIGAEVARDPGLDFGVFGHQVLVAPDGRAALFPCRGHDAAPGVPERPGALRIFGYAGGRLSPGPVVAPGGGYGFGPRHLDFDPAGRRLFLLLERQSELCVFDLADAAGAPEPLHRVSTLAGGKDGPARQAASAIHVHPNGRFVYVSNRAYGSADGSPWPPGEDSIAVFAIDPDTGAPAPARHAPTGGRLPRTFAIDPSGRMLVAANSEAARERAADGAIREVPRSLVCFRIGPDGGLSETGRVEIPPERPGRLFWAGFL